MFISKVFITALISHQAISQTFETEAFNPGSLCGNGRLDAGEECDPLIVGSEECCTAECRNMAGSTVCAGGLGVCGGSTANGKCSTRKAQCNTLQSSALQFPSTPQTTITVHAPWDVCTVPKTAPSKIGSILPPFFQRQSTCSLACEGIQDNNQPFCIDFTKFTGVPSSLPDYMPCITDATANIDLNSITPANLPNAIPPGICMAGQCRPDLCSQQKCGGRGQCVLNQNVYLFAKQNINNAQFNAYVATPNNFSSTDAAALVQCRCNAGFSGANCQIVGNGAIPGSINGFSATQYNTAVGTSIVSTFLGTMVLIAIVYLIIRQRKTAKGKQNEKPINFNPAYYDNYGQPSTATAQSRKSSSAARSQKFSVMESNIGLHQASTTIPQRRTSASSESSTLSGSTIDFPTSTSSKSASDSRRKLNETNDNNRSLTQEIEQHYNEVANLPPSPEHQYSKISSNTSAHSDSDFEVVVRIPYSPRMPDELHLMIGDTIIVSKEYTDGWAKGTNTRTQEVGVFPVSCTNRK